MEESEVKLVVEEVNNFIQKELWFDFSLQQYTNDKLIITGGLSRSYPPMIEIYFDEVFFILLHTDWNTDTSKTILTLLEGEEAKSINLMFRVEIGNHLFRFTPEDCQNDFGCLVVARKISYKISELYIQ
ncbi:hypothetical protein LJR153_001994 [Paenibacillus sp. LjRoot153]|uniref:hypothetical protein n=1 Tax=Paenibacillus sp. LjRoot153 TaxID=3342270 RepID=UPI003ECF9A4F